VLAGEDPGAFQRNVNAELAPGQLFRIADRRNLETLAVRDDRVAIDLHLARKAAMYRIVAEEMRIGFDRSKIVDGDDLDILASRFQDCPDDIAADPAKSIDSYPHSHRS